MSAPQAKVNRIEKLLQIMFSCDLDEFGAVVAAEWFLFDGVKMNSSVLAVNEGAATTWLLDVVLMEAMESVLLFSPYMTIMKKNNNPR